LEIAFLYVANQKFPSRPRGSGGSGTLRRVDYDHQGAIVGEFPDGDAVRIEIAEQDSVFVIADSSKPEPTVLERMSELASNHWRIWGQ